MRPLFFLAFLLAASSAFASSNMLDQDLLSTSGVRVRVESEYNTLPPVGTAPIRVEIENRTKSDREWRLLFGGSWELKGVNTELKFQVPARSKKEFRISVPITPQMHGGFPQMQVRLNGHAMDDISGGMSGSAIGGSSSGNISAFFLISDSIYGPSSSEIQKVFSDKSWSGQGSPIEPARLSADPRDWIGVSHLFIQPSELAALGGEQRAAIQNWLYQGGRLHLCLMDAAQDDARPLFDGWTTNDRPWRVGAGRVETFLLNEGKILPEPLWDLVKHTPLRERLINDDYERSKFLREAINKPGVNEVFVMGVILLFGLAVAPLNLIIVGRMRRRHLLFFSIPILSLVATGVLVAGILIGDGTGGKGNRFTLVLLQPRNAMKTVITEELSTTGLLTGSKFSTLPETVMIPLANVIADRGNSHMIQSIDFRVTPNGERSGDWYASRSIRGFVSQSTLPTREKIAVLREGEKWVLRSQIDIAFDQLFYFDSEGRPHTATNVAAGNPVELSPVDLNTFRRWLDEQAEMAGPRNQSLIEEMSARKNVFFASSKDKGIALKTLPSIQFREQSLVIGEVLP